MPSLVDKETENNFNKIVHKSIGSIEKLQIQANEFRENAEESYSIRDQLNTEEQCLYDEMKKVKAKQQRWSDGLVFYSSLETKNNKCPMNAIFELFILSGILCFLGLAGKQPIRGAIETSWGVELHENELYGPVVANSYELESNIAQYPRIVVGQRTIDYLNAHIAETIELDDKLNLYNQNLAKHCINIVAIDTDGHYIINYLGKLFTDSVTHSSSKELYKLADSYICEQIELHRNSKNSKLAIRYAWLKGYFHQNAAIHT